MDPSNKGVYSIISRRGIFFRAFGIYNELAGFYDYGPVGARIRKGIEKLWRKEFVTRTCAYEIETSLLVSEPVLTASGHLATFTDPITYCEVCGTPYRADKLVEAELEKHGNLDEAKNVKKESAEELEKQLKSFGIKCEKCGNKKFSKIEKFNLIFNTHVGPTGKERAYLRPETAQGIFVDFYELWHTQAQKLPMLIAQSGKSFRNEISPRQLLIRQREFCQLELELFFDPKAEEQERIGVYELPKLLGERVNFAKAGSESAESLALSELLEMRLIPNKYFALLLFIEKKLIGELGISDYRFRQLEPEELPHYSKANVDLEANTTYGYVEIAGNAYRTDYDLSQHAKLSGKDLSVGSGPANKLVPHVIEASMGLDRLFLAALEHAYQKGGERGWPWLKLNEEIAPYKYAVLPLQKDEKLTAKASELYIQLLEKGISCYYSEAGSIGKRYAKADEIGVPYCITIDYKTLEDNTVTIRNRDDTKQVRKDAYEI
ncbi:MAG: glycine--tRNA ligase [Candidatus Micrarchaeaceae archaeon]